MHDVIGWDIGGVNTKVARVVGRRSPGGARAAVRAATESRRRSRRCCRRSPSRSAPAPTAVHAVTMTAELSQMFRTKREGVAFVLDAVEAAFPSRCVRVYAVDGRFLAPAERAREPLAVAAANWSATAHAVARQHR